MSRRHASCVLSRSVCDVEFRRSRFNPFGQRLLADLQPAEPSADRWKDVGQREGMSLAFALSTLSTTSSTSVSLGMAKVMIASRMDCANCMGLATAPTLIQVNIPERRAYQRGLTRRGTLAAASTRGQESRARKKRTNGCANLVIVADQQMSPSFVDDQIGSTDLAGREFS